jgi:hypothetical protein
LSNKASQKDIESAWFQRGNQYVPAELKPGAPVPISRALLRDIGFMMAFRNGHDMTVTEALRRGLVTITNDPPASQQPQGQQGNNQN